LATSLSHRAHIHLARAMQAFGDGLECIHSQFRGVAPDRSYLHCDQALDYILRSNRRIKSRDLREQTPCSNAIACSIALPQSYFFSYVDSDSRERTPFPNHESHRMTVSLFFGPCLWLWRPFLNWGN
jgi:hypothetical protein